MEGAARSSSDDWEQGVWRTDAGRVQEVVKARILGRQNCKILCKRIIENVALDHPSSREGCRHVDLTRHVVGKDNVARCFGINALTRSLLNGWQYVWPMLAMRPNRILKPCRRPTEANLGK